VFGEHTETCRDSAERLVAARGAFVVRGPGELGSVLLRLLGSEAERSAAGRRALETVVAGRGATRRTVDFLSRMGIIDAERE
jgi:3-deoxy-D-manno-octulosonic-acid transferase